MVTFASRLADLHHGGNDPRLILSFMRPYTIVPGPCTLNSAPQPTAPHPKHFTPPKVRVEKDEESVGRALCAILEQECAAALASRGSFSFAISGGSMLKMLRSWV